MIFVYKMTFFQLLFSCNVDREKVIGEVVGRNLRLFRLEQYRFQRAPKFAFFQRGQSMVFVKN